MSCGMPVNFSSDPVFELCDTYPELSGGLEPQNKKGKDCVAQLEDLEGQDRLFLTLLNGDKYKQKNNAEAEENEKDRMTPGNLGARELDGQKQCQDGQGKQDGALKVDTAELALLADGAFDGVLGLGRGRVGQVDGHQENGEDNGRDLAVERP